MIAARKSKQNNLMRPCLPSPQHRLPPPGGVARKPVPGLDTGQQLRVLGQRIAALPLGNLALLEALRSLGETSVRAKKTQHATHIEVEKQTSLRIGFGNRRCSGSLHTLGLGRLHETWNASTVLDKDYKTIVTQIR